VNLRRRVLAGPEGAYFTHEKSGGMKMAKKKTSKKLSKGKKLESKKTLTVHGAPHTL
jgi:hypothetical protein